jgi:peptide/nickel transport system substrate-binding protein
MKIKPFAAYLPRLLWQTLWLLSLASTVLARDNLRIGLQLEPPMLDPTATAAATAGELMYCNVLEGLTVLDGQGQLQPRLASGWRVSSDGLRYEFDLRTDVRFHDGKAFNAPVATFSLQRILAPESKNPQKPWFAKIRAIEPLGGNKLVITLNQPDALLPFALALPAAVMVHPDSAASNASQPVGTGPFRFVNWRRGQAVQLARFDKYWGKKPALSSAQFLFMHTTAESENMLAEGLVDGLASVTKVTDHFMVRPDYKMRSRNLESKMILAINNARPPFNDVGVRRALAHAIDREKLSLLYGPQLKADLIGSHFSPSQPAYVNLVQRYPYDPKLARSLLTKAGVAAGTPLTLNVPPTDYGRFGGLQVAADLEAIGFRVALVQLDWKRWMTEVFEQKNYDVTLILHVEPMDLNIYARDNYYFNYDNTRFKSIWQKVLGAGSDTELNQLLGDAQRLITEDAVNVFLFMRPERNFMHRDLAGMWEKSPIPSFVLEDIYWTK